jgi:hypothetical protein
MRKLDPFGRAELHDLIEKNFVHGRKIACRGACRYPRDFNSFGSA